MFHELKDDLEGLNFSFMRHGESLDNLVNVVPSGKQCQGLSPTGYQQAINAAEYFLRSGIHFDIIVSSPILRASQTAEIISKKNNTDILYSSLFQEQDLGDWEGASWDMVLPFLKSGSLPPNGEAYDDFDGRIGEALRFIKSMDGKSILVISHGGFWYSLNKLLSGGPLIMPDNAELRKVSVVDQRLIYSTEVTASEPKKVSPGH